MKNRSIHLICYLMVMSILFSLIGTNYSYAQESYPIFEEFTVSEIFTSTYPSRISIANGMVVWNLTQAVPEDQFIYREIPSFEGDVKLTVLGQINSHAGNYNVDVGIGDNYGEGPNVTLAYYGTGCATQGYYIGARVTSMSYHESYCSFWGDWLWINNQTPYVALLTLVDGNVTLEVDGVGSAYGTSNYSGVFDTLWIGNWGGNSFPNAAGTIDYVIIEPLGDINEGPITSNVLASPNPSGVNGSVNLTANVDDTTTGGSHIASAEYSLGGDAWALMSASNGNFDEVSEDVAADLIAPTTSGIYDLCARGTDVMANVGEATCIMLIVYDPSAGFVTGGGWIDSPVNEEYEYMQVGGKANFGFVSKYKKGVDVPEGNTEFQFMAGNLNFHSDHYMWLVVTGSNYAKFMGKGIINGEGINGELYRFQVWAGDNTTDTFRIKIWWEDEAGEHIVYDNGMNQAISGGSIVIHTK